MREKIENDINFLIQSDGYVGQDQVVQYVLDLYSELLNENDTLKRQVKFIDDNLRMSMKSWNNKILDKAKEIK